MLVCRPFCRFLRPRQSNLQAGTFTSYLIKGPALGYGDWDGHSRCRVQNGAKENLSWSYVYKNMNNKRHKYMSYKIRSLIFKKADFKFLMRGLAQPVSNS
jgi:hypothetical protein